MGPYAEGDHRPCSQHHEDQDHRSTREEVLCLDRRLHPGLTLHLPVHVDLQGGVRRVRCLHRPQEVLLDWNKKSNPKKPALNRNKQPSSKKKKNPPPKKKKKKKKKK